MNKTIKAAAALLVLGLTGCGGGGGSSDDSATTQPVAAADPRVLVSQYKPASPAPLGPAQALTASDYQFVTTPLMASSAVAAVVVPAPALAQRALLIAATPPGVQRDELLAQPGDLRGLAAGIARRELQSLAGFGAWPEWLQTSALGSAEGLAPGAWRATPLASWDSVVGTLPAGFSPSLRVVDSVDRSWNWPGAVESFDGVFEHDSGEREQRRMLRLNGTGWALATAEFSAQGLVLGDGAQLIKLRPVQGPMVSFARSAALGEALVVINQRLRAGLALANSSMVLGDLPPELADAQALSNVQRLGSPESLPFTQLDGRGHYAELRRAAAPSWNGAGLRLAGGQELLFIGSGSNSFQSGGVVVTIGDIPSFLPLPACPGAPVLRPELLLAVDAQYRLLWLARLPSQGSNPQTCL